MRTIVVVPPRSQQEAARCQVAVRTYIIVRTLGYSATELQRSTAWHGQQPATHWIELDVARPD